VKIDAGSIQGTMAHGIDSFKGIPYAAPPVGKLRWRNPQPVKRWHGVLEAADFGPACMQADNIPKSEDCLTLNVWRPAAPSKAPRAVMVWIYGGALTHGNTAQYPGEALAAQGVAVVSINYRLGRLGFFAHPALVEEAPNEPVGNYGYMDQLAALNWVHRNIGAFGGDPAKVTIFGESAGGGSVLAHMVSPLSRGLFRGAILQSPGLPTARADVLSLTALATAERNAITYARSVGIDDEGAAGLAALRALPAGKLVEDASVQAVLAGLANGHPVVGVSGAILDGRFLTNTPEAALAAGNQQRVAVIVGANSQDLAVGTATTKEALFARFGTLADKARTLYDPSGHASLDDLKQAVLADMTLVESSRHLANETAHAGQPTWWYRFSYVAGAMRSKLKGTPHGFEIPYTLDVPSAIVGKDAVTVADRHMATLASGYWVSFAKTGDPNGGGRPRWPRHESDVDSVLDFSNGGVTVGPDPLKSRLDLWQQVWETGH
jgi:para-nitrobenzyl esterase